MESREIFQHLVEMAKAVAMNPSFKTKEEICEASRYILFNCFEASKGNVGIPHYTMMMALSSIYEEAIRKDNITSISKATIKSNIKKYFKVSTERASNIVDELIYRGILVKEDAHTYSLKK